MALWDLENCTLVFGRCEIRNDTPSNVSLLDEVGEPPFSVLFRNQTRFWIQRVLVLFVVGIGVLSNIVTMVVLTRRRMRSSTNMYLTALAASDLLFLLFTFTMSVEHYPHSHDPKYFIYWQYRRFGIWLTDATSMFKHTQYTLVLKTRLRSRILKEYAWYLGRRAIEDNSDTDKLCEKEAICFIQNGELLFHQALN